MKRVAICLVAFISSWSSMGQTQFSVHAIPDSLTNDANAVVRKATREIWVVNEGSARERVTTAITVLNSRAKHLAPLYIHFDQFSKIISYSGAVYDRSGSLIKKLKKSDFEEISASSNGTLYGDSRLLRVEVSLANYPLTFHYEYEKEYSGLLFIHPFDPIPDYQVSVQEASYAIKSPKSIGLRHLAFNGTYKFTDNSNEQYYHYQWEVNNLPPVKPEAFSPPSNKIFPYVLIGVEKFKMDSYLGDMSSWDTFGQWIKNLNEGKNDLGHETIVKVNALTAGISEVEKVKRLYEYLQSKTRYVSIQLGIGGWQPFQASMVDKNGYGDCKALVYYMKSLLEVAGINSYYTLVKAGSRSADINLDFPSSQFNHVILAVPLEQDTIWLECTSQTQPFGFLGSFTADRHVLLINETGGHIVRTPRYPAEENLQITKTLVDLNESGEGELSIFIESRGIQTENNGLENIATSHESEQKKWLLESFGAASFDLLNFKISKENDLFAPVIKQEINMLAKNIYSTSGSRIFIKPNIVNPFDMGTSYISSERKLPIHLKNEFIDLDTATINIPVGFAIEYIPPGQEILTDFGSYTVGYVEKNNQLVYHRKLMLQRGEFEATKYPELISFFQQIKRHDDTKVVFVKRQ